MKSLILYHGTLAENLPAIQRYGLRPSPGWVVGNQGVFLSASRKGALYWAKMNFLAKMGEKLEPSRFERKFSRDSLAIVKVTIPAQYLKNLRADMEQAEDYGEEIDENDWQGALKIMGDVLYKGAIPPEWVVITK